MSSRVVTGVVTSTSPLRVAFGDGDEPQRVARIAAGLSVSTNDEVVLVSPSGRGDWIVTAVIEAAS